MERGMNRFESKVGGLQASVGKLAGAFGLAFGATEVIRGIGQIGSAIVKLGADMEQTRVSFTTMLGSAEKANETIQNLRKFAEITPFGQSEVITGAKQLLAFGFQAESLTDNLTMLGDISAGLSIPIGDMIYLFGTLKAQGRAMTKDIMQFAQRGIPIYEHLAKVLFNDAKATAKVGKALEDGQVTFDIVNKAFENMTKSGSMFGGLMEKQSKTLAGRWSTLQDQIESMGVTLGEKLVPSLGKTLDFFTSIVEILPSLDFTPLFISYQQIISGTGDLFRSLMDLSNAMGITMTKMSAFQVAISYLGFALRVGTTPLRIAINLFKVLATVAESVAPIIEELGRTFHALMSFDLDALEASGNRLKMFTRDATRAITGAISEAMHEEKQGWKRIFNPQMGAAADSAFAKGTGTTGTSSASGTAGKDKEVGVEKISSGTRNITLNINQLVGEMRFEKSITNVSDSELADRIKRILLTAVNDVNIVAQ